MSTDVKESYFWQQAKMGLEDLDIHLSRIENTAGTGISDVSACRNGVEVWIELKVFHGRRMYFRNSQRSWISKRSSVGGRIFILARKDDELRLYRAMDVMVAEYEPSSDGKSFSVSELNLGEPLYRCCKPFRWGEVRAKIFGET